MSSNPVTAFPRLRTVYLGPQGTRRNRSGPGRNFNAVEEALSHSTRKLCIRRGASRTEAVRQAKVVIAFGPVKKSFGKPTLKILGELNTFKHSDEIRRFLKSTGATSVAFALSPSLPYWKVFRLVRHAFDWSRKDFNALSHEEKQEIRELHATGDWSQRALANSFGISQPAITYIVTGYADHTHFQEIREKGFVTLNQLAEDEGVYWCDVEQKVVDLDVSIHKVGPMYRMVDRHDARRLRRSLRCLIAQRVKNEFRRRQGCGRGHPWSEENTGWKDGGRGYNVRFCKTCQRASAKARYHKKKALRKG